MDKDVDFELNELASKTDKDFKIRSNHRAFVARKLTQEATAETQRKSAETARLMDFVASIRERGLLPIDQDVSLGLSSSKTVDAFARRRLLDDLAHIEQQTADKVAHLDAVLKENAQLRKRIAELRARQIGLDDDIVALVAPNRRRVLETYSLGGPAASEAAIREHLERQSKAALEAETRKRSELAARIHRTERQLARDSQRAVELEGERDDIDAENEQLRRKVAEQSKAHEAATRGVMRWREKVASEERDCAAQMAAELTTEQASMRAGARATVQAVQSEVLRKQTEAARREAAMSATRMERCLREAIAVGKEVAQLKKERERIIHWAELRRADTVATLDTSAYPLSGSEEEESSTAAAPAAPAASAAPAPASAAAAK